MNIQRTLIISFAFLAIFCVSLPAFAEIGGGGRQVVQCIDNCGFDGGNFGFFGGWGGTPLQGNEPGGGCLGDCVTPPPAPTCTLTANPTTITSGGTATSTLSWSLSNYTSFVLTNFAITQGTTTQTTEIDCSSLGYQYQDCPLSAGVSHIQSVSIVTQYSYCNKMAPYDCTPMEGTNYGIKNDNTLWVDKGYRARFAVTYLVPGTGTAVTSGTGTGTDTISGTTVVSPPQTTKYEITLTGPGGTAHCDTTVTVTPPPPPPPPPPAQGCIFIKKETFDTQFNPLTPVAQFTFKLDGATTTTNDSNGDAAFMNVPSGLHHVSEILNSSWIQYSVTPGNGDVLVPPGSACATVLFKNKQVVGPPPPPTPPVTIQATKIVCDNESDLPDWSGTSHNISATTATDYVAAHPSCHLESGWKFDWAQASASNPGDNIGFGGTGFTAFGPTNSAGVATTSVATVTGSKLWVREEMQSGFVPFSGHTGTGPSVSAEMYCENDVLNYDNFDFISNPTAGHTYYCVAFNAHTTPPPPPPGKGCINVKKETFDTQFNPLTPVAQFTFKLDGVTTTVNNSLGDAIFTDVTPGTHTVTEVDAGPTWVIYSTTPTNGTLQVPSGPACATVLFKNKQVVGTPPPPPPPPPSSPQCTLAINHSQINAGDPVVLTWTSSNATAGSIDHNVGTISPVAGGSTPNNQIFPSQDTEYTGTFGNGTATTTCSVTVTINHGGGGCTSGCGGGGYSQPTVLLYGTPNSQPLAFVSLSQVPYTGFEAGALLTFVFWFAVALWSAGIAYVLMGKRGMRAIAERAFAFAPGVVEYDEGAYHDESPSTQATMAVMPSVMTMPMPVAPVQPAAPVAPVQNASGLSDTIETRAHAAGVLLSPEALTLALGLSTNRDQTLETFGKILNDAVRTLPREDGWILLSSDRFAALSSNATVQNPQRLETPVAAQQIVSDSAAEQLARAVVSRDRDSAFSLIRTAEADGLDPLPLMTSVASLLDKLYHARRDNTAFGDVELMTRAEALSNESLEHMVEVFTHSTGKSYASPFTAVKLALAQAFDVK